MQNTNRPVVTSLYKLLAQLLSGGRQQRPHRYCLAVTLSGSRPSRRPAATTAVKRASGRRRLLEARQVACRDGRSATVFPAHCPPVRLPYPLTHASPNPPPPNGGWAGRDFLGRHVVVTAPTNDLSEPSLSRALWASLVPP
ncbi:unnamed protein product [Schistocephalus solidus]|uniref:Uncharacterized protein n=1 Tax=Schistocephalus solidus TaxID=70667 RepID=A0A183TES8_SCHSO|nr:unnamed protein product [Schistocephalus solidus]